MTDLVKRLRSLARHEHDDASIGSEAADEIERYEREDAIKAASNATLLETVKRLRARIGELEQDAARYRWLRDNRDQSELWIRHYEFGPLNGDAADQAIDAAMEWE